MVLLSEFSTRISHQNFAKKIPFNKIDILREGPCSQGASWVVCGFGVPPYEFLNLYGIFDSRFKMSFGAPVPQLSFAT